MVNTGDKARKEVSNKVLGLVFLFIAVLILLVGYIAHLTNSVNFSIMMPDDILEFAISHIDLYFFEYTVIGFFTGLFLASGILYLRKKDNT